MEIIFCNMKIKSLVKFAQNQDFNKNFVKKSTLLNGGSNVSK